MLDLCCLLLTSFAPIPEQITTPSKVETSVGTLEFTDGVATKETVEKVYNTLDFQRAVDSYLNGISGVSIYSAVEGMRAAGVEDNSVLIFSGLMDAHSLFLTANADTVYFISNINLKNGPMVIETPPDTLGIFDDLWFRWILDFGTPGPDRGKGGKYLLVPPGYKGQIPDSGYFVGHAKTDSAVLLGRAFLENNNPKPAVDGIKQHLKIYPYVDGSFGTSVADFLMGKAPLAALGSSQPPKFVEGTGLSMNTIPPNNYSYYEMLNKLVQEQPAEALDPEIAGQFAAIGIVKGKPFQPDARMKKILEDAISFANGAARTIAFTPHESEGFTYYGNWLNPLFVGGYNFMDPPPQITEKGVVPYPATGARTLNARIAFFYVATGITPAMCMRLPGLGSQYLFATGDSEQKTFDGSKTYKVTLPPDIPAEKFWSLTVYDNETRSMLQTPQRFPRAGSQSYPTPAAVANADGSTTIYFSPTAPKDIPASNWIQTDPNKGWFVILRLYSPKESFFKKTWQPSDIQVISK